MTPWWANLIGVALGAMVGGGLSLWGVKIVQDRTDAREQRRTEVENQREQQKSAAEKASRLRSGRTAVLESAVDLLHELTEALCVVINSVAEEKSVDWKAAAADATRFKEDGRELSVRVGLYFQESDLVRDWSTLDVALTDLEASVVHRSLWARTSLPPSASAAEVADRGRESFVRVAERVRGAADAAARSARIEMARIDAA